ncbi:MAG: two-component system response regulator QseB [Rhodanobacter sp. 68-29]|nr:response regulator transcription factor [Rhodanobacter sp.]ODU74659.1 MAG: two-component system response regulator QseB [Rhodanobacter sp. SCN 69-32]OJY58126.1 MAG: two-component system response regulator QseB [Rhodanobacter sp. 68-29]
MKILVVEDQQRLGQFLRQGLSECAYTVCWVGTCREARDALAETNYDVIILDLSLPDGDDLHLLSEWRRAGFNEAVLILSARDTVEDRIKGLDIGADDYLPKPFSFDELLAHVRSLLRRQSTVKQTVITHRCVRLDLLGHTVKLKEQTVDLTSREFALLEIFMQNAGRTLTRSYISERIWPGLSDTNLLDVYMSRLRNKLEPGLGGPLFKTLRGVGYQLV